MYENWCRLIRVVNGNTVEADINLWFGHTLRQNIRLYGVENSPESMERLIQILPREFKIHVSNGRKMREGRVLAQLFVQDEQGNLLNINEMMIAQGFAKKE